MTRINLTSLPVLSRNIARRLQWIPIGTGSWCASSGVNGKATV